MHNREFLTQPAASGSVLVTGATGFIGRRLTGALLRAGCDVTALVLPGDVHNLPEGVRPCTGDVTDPAAVAEALAACGAGGHTDAGAPSAPVTVYHLAAIGMANPGLSMQEACRVNVEGVINVLDAVRTAPERDVSPVRRVVLVGSSYEYGARRSDDELDPFNPYSASKAAAWAFARAAYNAWQVPVVWVRPFQVYGPGQGSKSLVPAAILAAIRGEDFRMTKGEQQRDFVFVDDVVAGLLAAAHAPDIEGRVLDLGTGELRRVYDVVARIWSLAEAEGSILPGALPYRPGEVPAIPASVRHTRLLTGWESRTCLDAGLQITIDALRAEAEHNASPSALNRHRAAGASHRLPNATEQVAAPISAAATSGGDQTTNLGGADGRLEDDNVA